MTLKTCTKCELVKSEEDFPKIAGGRRAQCKTCIYAAHRARYAALPEAARKSHYEQTQAWKAENKQSVLASKKAWKARNPEKIRRDGALRSVPSRKAQPKWASKPAMDAIYERALLLTELTGVPHDVDHIVPLKGKTVCGLHVPENLQAIPARENKLKGSRYESDAYASR